MSNTFDTAARLIWLGETGHVGNGDAGPWATWASEVREAIDKIGARIEEFTEGFISGELSGKDYARIIAPYAATRDRLRDVFAVRDAASISWPTWGGIDHELARFDSRLLVA